MGCAGAGFSYRWYGLDADDYNGSLLGPDPKDDLAFAVCKPTETEKSPCVVMKAPDFFRMKLEHLDLQNRLKACEKKP